jgi:glycosyltransferase involved in cell wall biosynthesis
MPESKNSQMILIPTPGDHYSLATGSAIMSVLHEIVRKHLAASGKARIVVGQDTRHDIPDGECFEVRYSAGPSPRKKIVDAALSRLGLPRLNERARYRPTLKAIDPDFDGSVLIFNAPGAIKGIKNKRPRATVCLYAVNALFRTYTNAETRRMVNGADRIICCSQFIADDINKRLPAPSPKIKVVHNGVDTQRFIPPPPDWTGRDGVPKILFIGRVVPEKGPDLLLKAVRRLKGKVPPFKVRLVGSKNFALISELSPYERELRALAEPIQDIVEFQPSISRDKLLGEYHAASIFCAPSNWDDPFPLTVLEAMASGLPVVASKRGGIPEGGATEILYFSPPNVDELAECLAVYLQDAKTRAEWGARARKRAEVFDWQNQYNKLRQALEQQ